MTRCPVVPAAASILLLAACGQPAADSPAPTRPPDVVVLDASAQRQAGIVVGPVATASRAAQSEAPGVLTLDERQTARIGSLVEGIMLETSVEVGDRVRAGQVLATMHSPVVHDAWAAYRRAIAERRRLEKELAYATAAHERAQRLFADKAIALQEVQRADADRVAAEEGLDMGRTEVRRSEEELEHLGVTNADDPTGESGEQIPVRTPIAGIVLERLVTPGTAVTPGTPLFVVSNLSSLWAVVEIDELLLPHIHAGQTIAVHVAAYPDEDFGGVVALVGDTVNPRTRRVTIRCNLRNADGRLKPQMYATAVIAEGAPKQTLVAPVDAVQTINGQPTVFVAETEGRFRPRQVEVGAASDGMVEIRSGLKAGDPIAMTGSFVLKSELLKSVSPEG